MYENIDNLYCSDLVNRNQVLGSRDANRTEQKNVNVERE